MALVTEDGTGLANAESYVSVADADAHLDAMGFSNWDNLTTTEKEQALRRGTSYMEQAYRSRWQGFPRKPRSGFTSQQFTPQALSWPRWDVWVDGYPVDTQSIPQEIKSACAELAFKAASGDLNADLTTRIVSETVGPISTEYDKNSPQSVRYPAIDQMLSPFLCGGGASMRLSRA